jgi:hypothetical protein
MANLWSFAASGPEFTGLQSDHFFGIAGGNQHKADDVGQERQEIAGADFKEKHKGLTNTLSHFRIRITSELKHTLCKAGRKKERKKRYRNKCEPSHSVSAYTGHD